MTHRTGVESHVKLHAMMACLTLTITIETIILIGVGPSCHRIGFFAYVLDCSRPSHRVSLRDVGLGVS